MIEAGFICAALILMPLVISILDGLDVLPWFLDPRYSRLMYEALGVGFLLGLFMLVGLLGFTVAGWLA